MDAMDNVSIFLIDNEDGTPFLSIPKQDIQRLSIYPHKWLRFMLFAICGAHGRLSASLNGPPVQNDSGFTDLCPTYYYTPHENQPLHFVDHNLNATITRSTETQPIPYNDRFRRHIVRRDRKCVVTRTKADICDAAYIVPEKKGDAYIKHIVQSRRSLYPEIEISGIEDIRNGILLRADLHSKLARGAVAFLRTPNFALSCDDVPKTGKEVYPEVPFRITMQHLEPDECDWPVPDADAHLTGSEESLPPAIILDYVFGAAAYRRWKSNPDMNHEQIRAYHEMHYQVIPHEGLTRRFIPDSPDSEPERPGRPLWEEEFDMFDQLNLALMLLNNSPEELVMKFRKREQEEELREQEASRAKVLEWMGSVDMDVTV